MYYLYYSVCLSGESQSQCWNANTLNDALALTWNDWINRSIRLCNAFINTIPTTFSRQRYASPWRRVNNSIHGYKQRIYQQRTILWAKKWKQQHRLTVVCKRLHQPVEYIHIANDTKHTNIRREKNRTDFSWTYDNYFRWNPIIIIQRTFSFRLGFFAIEPVLFYFFFFDDLLAFVLLLLLLWLWPSLPCSYTSLYTQNEWVARNKKHWIYLFWFFLHRYSSQFIPRMVLFFSLRRNFSVSVYITLSLSLSR